jgi:hypothetical protein
MSLLFDVASIFWRFVVTRYPRLHLIRFGQLRNELAYQIFLH